MKDAQLLLAWSLLGWLIGQGIAHLLGVLRPRSWWVGAVLLAALALLTVISLARWLCRPRILSPDAVQHAQEQAAMRKALYDLLAPAKYGRSNFLPDTNDRYRRQELREFLREILDGRGDE